MKNQNSKFLHFTLSFAETESQSVR